MAKLIDSSKRAMSSVAGRAAGRALGSVSAAAAAAAGASSRSVVLSRGLAPASAALQGQRWQRHEWTGGAGAAAFGLGGWQPGAWRPARTRGWIGKGGAPPDGPGIGKNFKTEEEKEAIRLAKEADKLIFKSDLTIDDVVWQQRHLQVEVGREQRRARIADGSEEPRQQKRPTLKPRKKKALLMAQKRKWRIVAGDNVQVINGDGKDMRGQVKRVFRKYDTLVVKGVNVKKVTRLNMERMEPEEMHKEVAIHFSNVALIDPEDDRPTRIKFGFLEDGTKVRVSTRSGAIIPWPTSSYVRDTREQEGDTAPEEALNVSFQGR